MTGEDRELFDDDETTDDEVTEGGCVPRFVEKERRPPLRHQGIRSGGNLRVFENLAQTLVAVDAP